ncbi:hypothetical protein ACJMK2_013720 [Sinanodonta woodiana]|uniref:Mucin-13 n=1 Tax=Sinanodonta woodiana TaxID=1069815 RepID=A0ABD3V1N4_SINWO
MLQLNRGLKNPGDIGLSAWDVSYPRKGSIIVPVAANLSMQTLTTNGKSVTYAVNYIQEEISTTLSTNSTIDGINATLNKDKTLNSVVESVSLANPCNQCKSLVNMCSMSFQCAVKPITCSNNDVNITYFCQHKCTGIDCGQGACASEEDTTVCRCHSDEFYIYTGSRCQEKTPTVTLILALAFGIGGFILLILILTIIGLAVRRRTIQSKRLLDEYSRTSKRDKDATSISFRLTGTRGNYNRPQAPANPVWLPSDERGNLSSSLYLPPPGQSEAQVPSYVEPYSTYLCIDTTIDYTIKRPKFAMLPFDGKSS